MRERALLVRGRLTVGRSPLGGTRVTPAGPGAMTHPGDDDRARRRRPRRRPPRRAEHPDAQPDFEVRAEAADGVEAVERALALRPAPRHPRRLDAAPDRPRGRRPRSPRRAPEIRLLMLSMHDDEQYLFEALRAGRVRLRPEVRRRPRPRRGLPRDDARRGVPLPRRGRRARPGARRPGGRRRRAAADPLTPREAEVLKLIAEALHHEADRRGARSSAPRRSRTTATGSSRSSACTTASSSRATRSAAASSSRDQRPARGRTSVFTPARGRTVVRRSSS